MADNTFENIIADGKRVIKAIVDERAFKAKPTGADMGGITNRMKRPECVFEGTASDLAKLIAEGHTYTISYAENGTADKNFVSADMVALDFDDGTTMESALETCEAYDVAPSIVYRTFSDGVKGERFRIVCVLRERVTDRDEYKRIVKGFQSLFGDGIDSATCACVQRFHGTDKGIESVDDFATTPKAAFLTLYGQRVEAPKPARRVGTSVDELLAQFDFNAWLQQNFAFTKVYRKGDGWCYNPCPICGHDDNFIVSDDGKFNCFSKGQGGNSVISFLIQAHGMGKAEAVRFFKYDIMGVDEREDMALYRAKQNAVVFEDEPEEQRPEFMQPTVDKKTGEITGYRVCAPKLAEYIRQNLNYIFVRDSATSDVQRYVFADGYYKRVTDDELRGFIKQFITRFDLASLRMRDVNEVFEDITTDMSWVDSDMVNADENIINFQNGILHLDDMKLYPHDPRVLSTIQIPCEWVEEDLPTPVYGEFMRTLTNADPEKVELLEGFMGVALSNVRGYRMKKALFLVGPGNTGKSQLKSLTERLLGRGNFTGIDMKELEQRFGAANLHNKRLAGSSDMGFMNLADLRTFKKLTGGDTIFGEQKGKDGFEFTYNGVLWFCANDKPKFGGDKGEWVYNRMTFVECENVIPKELQDKTLLDKLYSERAGIVRRAVLALKRVIERGYNYADCAASEESLKGYKWENDTVTLFAEDCLMGRAEGEPLDPRATTKRVFDVYRQWCRENANGHSEPKRVFTKRMAEVFGDAGTVKRTKTNTYFKGLTFKPSVSDDYRAYWGD